MVVNSGWSDAGHFRTANEDDPYWEITVGLNCEWGEVLGVLVHELVEMGITVYFRSYEPINCYKHSTQDRLIVIPHAEFDQVTGETGDVLASIIPKIVEAHSEVRQWRKNENNKSQ